MSAAEIPRQDKLKHYLKKFRFANKYNELKQEESGICSHKEIYIRIIVAKRKACLQPEKTQGYQYLFAVQFFNSYVYRGRLVAGLDKVFENRDRHHRIRRQILRQNEGLIWFLAQS